MISVIIPVYNGESYLSPCVESVLASTCRDFELILVNDGSTDGTRSICEAYAKRDGRVRVLSQDNQGVSTARNRGLEVCAGEWVVFVDSDDLISPYFLEWIAREDGEADLLLFDFARGPADLARPDPGTERLVYGREELIPLLERTLVPEQLVKHGNANFLSPCARAYRTALIRRHGLRFDRDIFFGEDRLFNVEFLLRAERCVYRPAPAYFYTMRADSACHRPRPGLLDNYLTLLERLETALRTGPTDPRLDRAFAAWALERDAQLLYNEIFGSQNHSRRREKYEQCRHIRESEQYRRAAALHPGMGLRRDRFLMFVFHLRWYRAVGLLCHMGQTWHKYFGF